MLDLARHEIGHALVARDQGVTVFSINLNADGEGEVMHAAPVELFDRGKDHLDVGTAFALIAAAGQAAAPTVEMSANDTEAFRRSAIWLSGNPPHAYFALREAFIEMAAEIVDEHAEILEAAAAELVRRGVLSGEEFAAICEEYGT